MSTRPRRINLRNSLQNCLIAGAFYFGIGLMMSGCVEYSTPARLDLSPSATQKPKLTDTHTPTATQARTPTPAKTFTPLPTPALSASTLSDDFLFEPSGVPGCELPCWQGLEVGKSGREEIQAMFDTVFAFNGTRQFVLDDPPPSKKLSDEFYGTGNIWYPSYGEERQTFIVNVLYESDTFLMRGLRFSSEYTPFNIHLTPYRVIQELGQPSDVVISLSGTERGDILRFVMQVMYDAKGMVFVFGEVYLPAAISITENGTSGSVELCLDDESWNKDYGVGYRMVSILDPLENGLDNLNPVQERLIPLVGRGEGTSLTDFFGVSLEDVTQLALQNSNTCLFAEFSY